MSAAGTWARVRGPLAWFLAATAVLLQLLELWGLQGTDDLVPTPLGFLLVLVVAALSRPLDLRRGRRLQPLLETAATFGLLLLGTVVLGRLRGGLETSGRITFDVVTVGVALVIALSDAGGLLRILRLVRLELLKLWKGRLFRVGLVAALAVTAFAAWDLELQQNETGWTVAMKAMDFGTLIAEVFLLVLGATSITGEISQGTLKMILPHAYRRSDWIAAKASVLIISALLFTLAVALGALVTTGAVHGLDDVTRTIPAGFGDAEDTVEVFQSADVMWERTRAALYAAGAALLAHGLLGLLLSCLFSSVVPALSLGFLLFMGLRTADILLRLPEATLAKLYAWHPPQLRLLAEKAGAGLNDALVPGWQGLHLYPALLLAAAVGLLAWLVAVARFTRRDFHG